MSKLKKYTYFVLILSAVILFTIGVLVGNNLQTVKSNEISSVIKQSELNTESFLIEQELFQYDSSSCNLIKFRLQDLSQQLWKIGKKLSDSSVEHELGKTEYRLLKRKYHLMQIRVYLYYKKFIDECGSGPDIILYYYDPNDKKSEEQGFVLDDIAKNFNVSIFAIQRNYSSELNFLEAYYVVERSPTIIINYETKKEGLIPYEQIAELIKSEKK